MKKKYPEYMVVFLKGLAMGICDLIPGISGGTIAFITGIYATLIDSVRKLFLYLSNYLPFYRRRIDKKHKDYLGKGGPDFKFLISLGSGIFVAILLGSRAVSFLLEHYFVYTVSFFMGLVIMSSKVIYNHAEKINNKRLFLMIGGFLFGLSLSFVGVVNSQPGYGYVFLGGFLAVSAMFLPGISGAFILLVLGLYEFMINALHHIYTHGIYLVLFAAGVVLGIVFISNLVSFLFHRFKPETLYFLLGLVIGALSLPLKKVLYYTQDLGLKEYVYMVIFLLGGVLISFVLAGVKGQYTYSFKED